MPGGQNLIGGHLTKAKSHKPESHNQQVRNHFAKVKLQAAMNGLKSIASKTRLSNEETKLVRLDLGFAPAIVKPKMGGNPYFSDETDEEKEMENVVVSRRTTKATLRRYGKDTRYLENDLLEDPIESYDSSYPSADEDDVVPLELNYNRLQSRSPKVLEIYLGSQPQLPSQSRVLAQEDESMTVDPHPELVFPDMDVDSPNPDNECTLATPLHSPQAHHQYREKRILDAFQHYSFQADDELCELERGFRDTTAFLVALVDQRLELEMELDASALMMLGETCGRADEEEEREEEKEVWLIEEDWALDFDPVLPEPEQEQDQEFEYEPAYSYSYSRPSSRSQQLEFSPPPPYSRSSQSRRLSIHLIPSPSVSPHTPPSSLNNVD